jgi:hypothetical protein
MLVFISYCRCDIYNYRPIVHLIIVCVCFSHVKVFAAVAVCGTYVQVCASVVGLVELSIYLSICPFYFYHLYAVTSN